jgi:drug/metabolite transporter (DMT)-like permease
MQTSAAEGDPQFLVQVVRERVWLLGAALQACGWVLQAVALERGSLIVVQSLCTLSLVFALPLGARLTAQQVGPRSVVGAGCTLVGIVAFLAVGQPQGGGIVPETATLLAWCAIVVAAIVGLALSAGRRRGPRAAALFATAAGITFGLQAAATKVFVTQLGGGLAAILTMLATYVLILSALVGFALQQSALKTGFLMPAMAASNAATLVTSVFLGVVLFGESFAASPQSLLIASGALALAAVGVVVLASPDRRAAEAIAP